jgi:hypothetical protein
MAKNSANRVVFRGPSTDYFIITREFVRQDPEAAREVVAGFVRALQWMRRERKNIELAATWTMADGEALTGKAPLITVNQAVEIARREILDIPSAPIIPLAEGTKQPLSSEFSFLRQLGKIPENSPWERVSSAFKYEGLREVMRDKSHYRLNTFNYSP